MMTKPDKRDATLNIRLPADVKAELVKVQERYDPKPSFSDILVPFMPAVMDGYQRRNPPLRHDEPA